MSAALYFASYGSMYQVLFQHETSSESNCNRNLQGQPAVNLAVIFYTFLQSYPNLYTANG